MREAEEAPKDRGRDPADLAMARYASGADEAFDALYDSLAPRLHAFLFRRARDAATAEDLLQQTFLQLHFARQHFTPGAPVMPWAFAIARRLLIDSFRRTRHEGNRDALATDLDEHPAPSSREQIDALVGKRRLARRVEEELSRLPEANRTAFELIRYDGLSMTEAAQALGVTVSAVKTRAFRAYECLRERLGDAVREELGEVT
jgi:RNA polymerase sigma-70 factor (ECF subfamily)